MLSKYATRSALSFILQVLFHKTVRNILTCCCTSTSKENTLFHYLKCPLNRCRNCHLLRDLYMVLSYMGLRVLKLMPPLHYLVMIHVPSNMYINFLSQAHTLASTVTLNVALFVIFQDKQYFKKERIRGRLHSVVGRSTASLWHYPVDVLTGVFNVTGLTVDTVLSVYL